MSTSKQTHSLFPEDGETHKNQDVKANHSMFVNSTIIITLQICTLMRRHGFTRAERTTVWAPPLTNGPVVSICAQPIVAQMPCASTSELSGATPSTKQPVATQCKMVSSSAACARLPRSRRTVWTSLDQALTEKLSHGDALLVGGSAEVALALPLAATAMPSVPPRTRCPLSRRPRLLRPRL